MRPHEGPGADTLLIKQEPNLSIMAVTQPGLSVTCFHCQASGESCRIDSGAARHCLVAQGWFRSPSGRKNWSCATCAAGYWDGTDEKNVTCCHLDELLERKATAERLRTARGAQATTVDTREWRITDPAAAETTPRALLTDIAGELEHTGNRLLILAARLRSATAERSPVPD